MLRAYVIGSDGQMTVPLVATLLRCLLRGKVALSSHNFEVVVTPVVRRKEQVPDDLSMQYVYALDAWVDVANWDALGFASQGMLRNMATSPADETFPTFLQKLQQDRKNPHMVILTDTTSLSLHPWHDDANVWEDVLFEDPQEMQHLLNRLSMDAVCAAIVDICVYLLEQIDKHFRFLVNRATAAEKTPFRS